MVDLSSTTVSFAASRLRPEAIDAFAYSIISTLQQAGFSAYVVGGGVRDQLLGLKPKDFDVVTDAHPEQVKSLFEHCRLIGHRFRLAHVFQRRHIVEVATFRASHEHNEDDTLASTHEGVIVRDNIYGTLEEDAIRRDLTINALYYDPIADTIIDLVGGVEDLKAGIVRVIGDPVVRFKEDPVRILRTIRIANKLGLQIEAVTAAEIPKVASKLRMMPPGRLFDEYTKLFLCGQATRNFAALKQYHILPYLFPQMHTELGEKDAAQYDRLVQLALENTDVRIQQQLGVNPAFLLAVLLWSVLQLHRIRLQRSSTDVVGGIFLQAVNLTLSEQVQHIAIPRRFSGAIRSIWALQFPLTQRDPERISSLLEHPKFRAAYDFMLLRVKSGELPAALGEWWTEIQQVDNTQKLAMIAALPMIPVAPRRKRRRKSRSRSSTCPTPSGQN